MQRRGAILIDRNLWDWWGWDDSFTAHAWIDLLLLAEWREDGRTVMFHGQVQKVERGQHLTSMRVLARRWGCSDKRVRDVLKKFAATGAIKTQVRTHVGTLLTISNYEEYQQFPSSGGRTNGLRNGRTKGRMKDAGSNEGNEGNEKADSRWKSKHDYKADWNRVAERLDLPIVESLGSRRKKHLRAREQEPSFDWPRLTDELGKVGRGWLDGWKQKGKGLTFDWVIKNDENYVRILERQYREKEQGIFG